MQSSFMKQKQKTRSLSLLGKQKCESSEPSISFYLIQTHSLQIFLSCGPIFFLIFQFFTFFAPRQAKVTENISSNVTMFYCSKWLTIGTENLSLENRKIDCPTGLRPSVKKASVPVFLYNHINTAKVATRKNYNVDNKL